MRRLLLVIACVCWVTPVAAQRPTVHTTVQTTATTASSLLVGCALGATTGCTGGINSGPIVVNSGGINIVSNVPGDTTMKLYNNSGTLTWNGTPLAAGSSLSGTTGTIAIFTASNAVGDSIITQTGGNTITVTGTLNATTAIQLNGASLNTAGTLSNVAYLNAANTFSNASGQTFAGGIGLSGGSPSTHGIMIPSAVPGITTTNLYNNGGVLTWSGGASFPGNVTVTTLNTYTFNQSVASGASPTLTGTNFTGIPAAGVTGTAAVLNAANSFTAGIGVGAGQTLALNNAGGNTYFTEVSSVALDAYADGYQMYRMYPTSGGHIWYGTAGATQMQLTMGGLLTVSGFGTHSFSAGGNAFNGIRASNSNNGAGASSGFELGNDQDTSDRAFIYLYSSGVAASGAQQPDGLDFRSGGTGGMSLGAANASGDVRLYSRNALALTLGASQAASFTGDLSLAATGKLYLDGGSNTYIYEEAADTISFFTNGTRRFQVATSTVTVENTADLVLSATKKLYLDGGGDSYIAETAANVVRIYAGGQDVVIAKSDGLYIGLVPTTASAANMYFNTSTARVEYSTSSLRYKHDIDTLDADHALSAVMAMRPVTYRGKTDDDQRRYVGFIAEEMMEIAPLLATYDEGGESGTPNYVTYDRVTAYLVAVVQKQQAEINALKAQMKEKQ